MDKKEIKYDVSVIIVTYNTYKLTLNCIESIFCNTKDISFEIILVDNASTDGSREYFTKDERIIYIYNDVNAGFGTANNIGYKYSSGKYIFLLNSDTILKNNAIKMFYDKMESLPKDVACCGAWLIDADGNHIHSYGLFPKWYDVFICDKATTQNDDCRGDKRVDYITGADLFVRRSVIEKYGMFDENFFMYYEETDMQERYRRQNFYSMIIDGPLIIHLEGKSAKPSIRKGNMMLESRIYYFKKRMDPLIFQLWKNAVILKRRLHLLFIK